MTEDERDDLRRRAAVYRYFAGHLGTLGVTVTAGGSAAVLFFPPPGEGTPALLAVLAGVATCGLGAGLTSQAESDDAAIRREDKR